MSIMMNIYLTQNALETTNTVAKMNKRNEKKSNAEAFL